MPTWEIYHNTVIKYVHTKNYKCPATDSSSAVHNIRLRNLDLEELQQLNDEKLKTIILTK